MSAMYVPSDIHGFGWKTPAESGETAESSPTKARKLALGGPGVLPAELRPPANIFTASS
ncbi:MAG TPA: hypothetical protein VFI57_02715 [Pyrinomonadaceae bacterium]|nr:hypothetical protein [Pyrinomonadaceae bacterium]